MTMNIIIVVNRYRCCLYPVLGEYCSVLPDMPFFFFLCDVHVGEVVASANLVNLVESTHAKVWVILLSQNLKYGWATLEDQIYFAFTGVSLFVVYMFVFPAMQFVYKHVTAATTTTTKTGEQDKGSSSSSTSRPAHERSSNSSNSSNEGPSDISDPERRPLLRKKDVSHAHMVEETVTQVGSNAGDSIRKDLAFFAMGALLLAVESTVIAVFDTPVILFIGKKNATY